MDTTFFTKLTYEHKSIHDRGPDVIKVEKTTWDLSGEEMVDMFHTIMIGAGFSEDGFKSSLNNWLEKHEVITKEE